MKHNYNCKKLRTLNARIGVRHHVYIQKGFNSTVSLAASRRDGASDPHTHWKYPRNTIIYDHPMIYLIKLILGSIKIWLLKIINAIPTQLMKFRRIWSRYPNVMQFQLRYIEHWTDLKNFVYRWSIVKHLFFWWYHKNKFYCHCWSTAGICEV